MTPHEIRVALYPGPFVDLLANLNNDSAWRELYGVKSPRLRDHELILRILALYLRSAEYYRPLKKFLNDFMGDHRDLAKLDSALLRALFSAAAAALSDAGARELLRRSGQRVNAALLESVMVAAMRRVVESRNLPASEAERALRQLVESREMQSSTAGSTATEDDLRLRLEMATAAFAAS